MTREPLYSLLANRVEALILQGEWPQGSRLPPERELARRFNVSRETFRQALGELEQRGLITRHQGRGTFVARPRVQADLSGHFTLAAALESRGMSLTTETLGVEVVEASRQRAEAVGVLPGDPLVRLVRLRSLMAEPLILETSHLPSTRFPRLEHAAFEKRSLYAILYEDFGCVVRRATETFEPVITTHEEADRLGLPRNAPALLLHRTAEDSDGAIVEHSQALLRGDRCSFLLRRRIEQVDFDLTVPDRVTETTS